MTEYRSIRVLPELRAIQVERASLMTPAEVWYFDTNYDLFGTSIPSSFVRVNLATAVSRLLKSKASVLEVPEPLWLRELPRTAVLLAVWRITGLFRGSRRRGRAYAIENNDPSAVVFGSLRSSSGMRRPVLWLLGLLIGLLYERIAFGSDGARSSYNSLPFVASVESALIAELPAPSAAATVHCPETPSAIFVGRLESRKGIDILLDAWSLVEAGIDNAVLTVIGSGPAERDAAAWASQSPTTRVFLGQLPHVELAPILSKHTVLVAPSRRHGRWREQIGLPIEEALSLGLTVVTSSETGLAEWLVLNHHIVVPGTFTATDLANAMISALSSPQPRGDVLSSLPQFDGRIAADEWIHND